MNGGRFLTKPLVGRMACWLILALFSAGHTGAQWLSAQQKGLDTNLRGVSVSRSGPGGDSLSVWAVGSNGVVLRSTDRGKNWTRLRVAGGEALDFRGIVALDANTEYLMSSGGDCSRLCFLAQPSETNQDVYKNRE